MTQDRWYEILITSKWRHIIESFSHLTLGSRENDYNASRTKSLWTSWRPTEQTPRSSNIGRPLQLIVRQKQISDEIKSWDFAKSWWWRPQRPPINKVINILNPFQQKEIVFDGTAKFQKWRWLCTFTFRFISKQKCISLNETYFHYSLNHIEIKLCLH